MQVNKMKAFLAAVSLLLLLDSTLALPLRTNSRWIVDEHGMRVKLACVNWPSHLQTMLAEGLDKQPLNAITKRIASMGFNCVRLTWPLFMVTNKTMGSITVRDSFERLELHDSIAGIGAKNKALVDLPVIEAYKEVASSLGRNNIMVILDNHISKPEWCCARTDGNGFFGDGDFNPDAWVSGLAQMAMIFNGSRNIIGMSLRNELRGPRQNIADWYKYMARGANAVHAANPNLLVILSGLNFDNDLSFLRKKPINIPFEDKLVYEFHWYSFSDGSVWLDANPNDVCGQITGNVMRKVGFLLNKGWPLFLSEFGADQRGGNAAHNRYLSCAMAVAAGLDLDWALWALQGSYYLRQGKVELDESFGVLNWDWNGIRNITFLNRIASIQLPFQGPGFSEAPPHSLLFHPATGLCVTKSYNAQPQLRPCGESRPWSYTSQMNIMLTDSMECLLVAGIGETPALGRECNGSNAHWEMISASGMHLASRIGKESVCLDAGEDVQLVTNHCRCLSRDRNCEADSQWFKIINSTRSVGFRRTSYDSFSPYGIS